MILGAVVLGVALAIFLTIRIGLGGTKKASSTGSTKTTQTAPAGATRELLQLLDVAQKSTYHVRYSRTGATGSDPGGTVELWRRPPQIRVDNESGSGDQSRHTALFYSPTGSASCAQVGSASWACKKRPDLGSGDVDVLSSGIVSQLARMGVVATDDTIAGEAVRCFALTYQGSAALVCLTADGVPMRVARDSTRFDLLSLDRSPPPDSIFVPPAPPG